MAINKKATNISLDAVLQSLQIQEWDVLLIGDGSGSGWQGACGWASILIDRATRGRRIFHGAMNLGSINVAESLPYIQALAWYDATQKQHRQNQGSTIQVHIVTDSSTVATWCNAAADVTRAIPGGAGLLIGSYIREMSRRGYSVRTHWAKRMSNQVNWAADLIAGLSRAGFINSINPGDSERTVSEQSAEILESVELIDPDTRLPMNIYEISPDPLL